MILITKELQKTTPKIGSSAKKSCEELVFYIKLFTPWTYWTWYIAEMNYDTGECFGLVQGHETELGYFNLNELIEIRHWTGLKVERDRHFENSTYNELMKKK
jgi:hypothetical protein